jgi:hypothetical protein
VLATYREIAEHFGLGTPHSGRTRAKREGWLAEPSNDPRAPLRIRVPQEAWEGARQDTSRPATRSHETSDLRLLLEAIRESSAKAEERALQAEERALRAEQRADRAGVRLDELLGDLRAERAATQQAQAESADERRRLLVRIAELEARLAELQAPAPLNTETPDSVLAAISEDLEREEPPSAWLEEAWGTQNSSDHSATADPAHQVERLWQRIEELEHRLEEARTERAGDQSETPAEPVPDVAEPGPPPDRPRRWWRRVLRRRGVQ